MKIKCPKCKRPVPPEQVNMGTDLAFCPQCNEGFKISEILDEDSFNEHVLRNPPKGAWFRREREHAVVGATTRSPTAFFLVPFALVWAGGSMGGIYGSQIIVGKFNPFLSLFGLPFLAGSIFLVSMMFMTVFGKTEVRIGRNSSVFSGIGPIGKTRRFDWSSIRNIKEMAGMNQSGNGSGAVIVMEGKERVKLGSLLNDKRRYFVLNALKQLKSETQYR